MSATDAVTVYIVAANEDEAQNIAQTIVRERLAACANCLGNMTSFYWWDGDVQSGTEQAILLKTTKQQFQALKERVLELHSYDCPCIVAWDICDGHLDYLGWITEETKPQK